VNGYLREAVLARADPGHADFEPAAHAQPGATGTHAQQLGAPASGHARGDAADAEAGDGDGDASLACAAVATTPTPALPPALWEVVLRLLTAPDVRAAGAVCVALRQAASSQARGVALGRGGSDAHRKTCLQKPASVCSHRPLPRR
jgi:hypothetical protein